MKHDKDFLSWMKVNETKISAFIDTMRDEHRKEYYLRMAFFCHNDELTRLKAENEMMREAHEEVYKTVNCIEILNITGVDVNTALSRARTIALHAGRVSLIALTKLEQTKRGEQ